MDFGNAATIALLAYVLAVAVVDLGTRRIPNGLTLAALVVAVVLNILSGGGQGCLSSAAGLCVGFALFLPFYLGGGFAAGDVKAMAAVGAFLGPKGAALAGGFTLLAGTVSGIVMLAALGGLAPMLGRWTASLALSRAAGRVVALQAGHGEAASHRFPYGLAIACGTAAALWWLGRTDFLIAV